MIWIMLELRVESVETPLLAAGAAASLALALVARAQVMGFLPTAAIVLDRDLLVELAEELRKSGIGTLASGSLARAARSEPVDPAALADALRATIEAVDSSPHPQGEWKTARELLDDDVLARLLKVSNLSLRRYAGSERRTPDEVAWRLHLVARLLAALAGSYNEYGVRRWFERPRSALGGATPAQVLEHADSEDDEAVQRLVALADDLMGAGAAA